MAETAVVAGSPVKFSVWSSFRSLWSAARSRGFLVVGIDMPIGLPGSELRAADIEARELLGPRRSSIFWTPPLCTLMANSHAEANRLSKKHANRGMSA